MTKRLERDVKGNIYKHNNAIRYINFYLKSSQIDKINRIVLKIILEQHLHFLEALGYNVRRK